MKRVHLLISIFMTAVLCLAGTSWAGEVSVYDEVQNILVRGFTTVCTPGETCPTDPPTTTYSAYLEVRDTNGDPIAPANLVVTNLMTASTVTAEANGTYKIHDNNLTTADFSMSIDNNTGDLYLFCTDFDPGLHMMKFSVVTTLPINGDCGSSDGGTFTSAPADGLCSAGNATTVLGSGPWDWTCTGIGTGTTANCSANLQGSGTVDLGFPVTAWGTVTGVNGSSTSNNTAFSQTITVKNTGDANAGSFTVKVYISPSSVIGPSAQLLSTWNVAGLAAGQTLVHTSTQSYSGLGVHTYYYMIVKVDADDQITEASEIACGSFAREGCNTFGYQFFVYR